MGVDLDALAERSPKFAKWWRYDEECDAGAWDFSDARLALASRALREFGDAFTPEVYLVVLENWAGAGVLVEKLSNPKVEGEFNLRNVARDYLRAKADDDGEAARKTRLRESNIFGAVEELDDYLPQHLIEARERAARERTAERATSDAAAPATKRRHGMLASEAVASWRPSEYLIKGLIPKRQLGLIYGPPDAKKSFTIIDAANHIARGREWQGLRTKRAGVVYWHGEGQQGIAGRVRAWCDEYGAAGGDIWLDDRPLNFTKTAAGKEQGVGDDIKAMLAEAKAALGLKVELLIIDTLSKATIGMKANDETDAARVMANAEAVVKRLDVTILFVAHSGKDAERGVRGSNVLEGNVDFHLRMDKGGLLTIPRMKDGRKAEPRKLAFVERKITTDADGDDVTSLVIPKPKITTGELLGAVDDEAEAPNLPAPATPAAPPSDRPLTRKEQEAAERKARGDAHRHANSKDGRAETMLQAAADIGAGGHHFLLDELRDRVNAIRAESPHGLGGMAQSSFKGTLAQLREAGRIVWASGQTNLARYRLVG